MMIVPAGSLVEYSTSVRRNCGGSCFFGPVSGRTSAGNAAMLRGSTGAPLGALGSPCPPPIWSGLIGIGGRVAPPLEGGPTRGGAELGEPRGAFCSREPPGRAREGGGGTAASSRDAGPAPPHAPPGATRRPAR